MSKCILCLLDIPIQTKPEHVLLNALGGRKTVHNVLCPDCNHKMGIGPDQDLAESVRPIRSFCDLKAGDGDDAPPVHAVEAEGQRFDLLPGMVPVLQPKNPLEINFQSNSVSVQVNARDKKHAERLIDGAARKIVKTRKLSETAIELLKKELKSGLKLAILPGPAIRQDIAFGHEQSQQAMAKAALVLWANCVGNEEVLTSRYDDIRQFIWNGDKPEDPGVLVKIDARPLPELPDLYGGNPNLIWVGSDAAGRVFGYFRLFAAIGWRIVLCENGGIPDRISCLISNPIEPSHWDLFEGKRALINYEWINADWEFLPPAFEAAVSKVENLRLHANRKSEEKMVQNLLLEVCEKFGLCKGQVLTPEIANEVSVFLAKHLTSYITKTSLSEEFDA
ncbi:HNH endonuclease [Pseudovibrio sp. Tun.PSC04-5.I4]|uniref:HNH endonuclease n=1 Tax=Pseudovibrio sp. Tun.PSC04-5.I4 TaxID=1798213 RepID=UPI00088C2B6E|nr:HNH endonuclease [Pseudovibrio sp. Tun.PSC04-5.I4]SDR32295.1 HNH endonuclease [Pseudovibrio sp. Tun.PSC04-5.I4]